MLHDAVLDFLLIPLKIAQELVLVPVQVSADVLLSLPVAEFRADGDVLLRAQETAFHVQLELAAGQHIKPPGGMDAEYVHGQLLDGEPGGLFLFFLRPPLEIPDNGAELLPVQRIALPGKALPVQVTNQGEV